MLVSFGCNAVEPPKKRERKRERNIQIKSKGEHTPEIVKELVADGCNAVEPGHVVVVVLHVFTQYFSITIRSARIKDYMEK